MADNTYVSPRVFVDVYPYEGGKYSLNGNSPYLRVTTSKSIANGGSGRFSIDLAPSGPFGANARPSWADVFTPFSLVIIGMRRGSYSQIVMVGLVSTTTQAMQRNEEGVSQVLHIEGEDFTKFFNVFSYYGTNYLLGTGFGAFGQSPAILANTPSALQGNPDQVGEAWLNQIMLGPRGVMGGTELNYNGNMAALNTYIASTFEAYPGNASIPTLGSFIAEEGSWMAKFLTFFPTYFFEFFINTAPAGLYPNTSAAGITFSMDGFTSVSPTVVARVNPLPCLTASGSATSPTYDMDLSRWGILPNFTLDNNRGVLSQQLAYTDALVKNFYVLDTSWISTLYGGGNGSITPFQLQFAQWTDPASINRYGFRPQQTVVKWFADAGGAAGQVNQSNPNAFTSLVTDLSLRPVSYHEPTPFMLFGSVVIELRPDIMPGCRFTYAPFRDGVLWTFYVESVQHSVQFGGRATTTLTLGRGLPADQNGYGDLAFLLAIHTGNAQRINGQTVAGLPPNSSTALTPVNGATLKAVLEQTSPFFGPRN